MSEPEPTTAPLSAWCEPDGCPTAVCNGPHVSHHCPNGDLVVSRYDDPTPCPGCGAVIVTVGSTTPSEPSDDAADAPGPMTFTAADQQELDALESQAHDLNLELRARGGGIPLGPVRLESLIDFLLGDETPERLNFELHFRRHQVAVLKQGIAAAVRQSLVQGVRGNGNGRPHSN